MIELFEQLFAGRSDVTGGDAGVCLRQQPDYRAHLDGTMPMGIYPLLDDATTWWGCIDVDVDDIGLAANTWKSLKAIGLSSYVERSRSKGYHVWCFFDQPMPAALVRRALLVPSQLLGNELLSKEVNPKQAVLVPGSVGNYVRLPYPDGLHQTPERQVILDMGRDRQPVALARFVTSAMSRRNTLEQLTAAAALYREPVAAAPAPVQSSTNVTHMDRYIQSALTGEYQDIAGCASGGRNHRLYQSAMKLARLVERGLSESQIEATLMSACEANGLLAEDGDHSVRATIRSGIRNGSKRVS